MRHGVREEDDKLDKPVIGVAVIPGSQLGCYFCNDVVAPGDVSLLRVYYIHLIKCLNRYCV